MNIKSNTDEAKVESMLAERNIVAPRLRPEDIDAAIVSETYTILPSGKMMICELVLKNGFAVFGEAAVVSREGFVKEIGMKISREKARNKVWELEGYLLQEKLSRGSPVESSDDAIANIRNMLRRYHQALNERAHGMVAAGRLINELEVELQMFYQSQRG